MRNVALAALLLTLACSSGDGTVDTAGAVERVQELCADLQVDLHALAERYPDAHLNRDLALPGGEAEAAEYDGLVRDRVDGFVEDVATIEVEGDGSQAWTAQVDRLELVASGEAPSLGELLDSASTSAEADEFGLGRCLASSLPP